MKAPSWMIPRGGTRDSDTARRCSSPRPSNYSKLRECFRETSSRGIRLRSTDPDATLGQGDARALAPGGGAEGRRGGGGRQEARHDEQPVSLKMASLAKLY